jgi:hypothetical protein
LSIADRFERPRLRHRRFGGGYRREDVEFALAELRLTLSQLESDLGALRERNRQLEDELTGARSELESLRAREQESAQRIVAALSYAAEIEELARARARETVEQAEEAARAIRLEASRRIEVSNAQFSELLRLKDELVGAMRKVVGDFDHAISRVEHGGHVYPSAPGARADDSGPEPGPAAVAGVEEPTDVATSEEPPEDAPPGSPAAPPPTSPVEATSSVEAWRTTLVPGPPAPVQSPPVSPPEAAEAPVPSPPTSSPTSPEGPSTDHVFDTRVELDAGPFPDFAAVSAFERALAHLPDVQDAYVRRLADERALIEITLGEATPLLRTMHESLPYVLELRSASRSRIVVDVSARRPAEATIPDGAETGAET